jgi:3D (Asp-Asp-Asp) domain-containing protein
VPITTPASKSTNIIISEEQPFAIYSTSRTAAKVLSEPIKEWLETSAKLVSEPSVAAEDLDKPYVEVVAIPLGTPTSLGVFTITAYCDCVKCNGKWTGYKLNTRTQAGHPYPVVGYTVSVDPRVIPLGSVVILEGLGARFAQDTGGAIKGNKIDLFMNSHEEALIFGVKKLEVWIYE